MKKFINQVAYIKMEVAIIWIGMLAMYIVSKSILGVFQISFITIIQLILMAVIVTIVKRLFESDLVTARHNTLVILILQYILIGLIIFGFNQLFSIYVLNGIEYLYFGLFITFAYLGSLLGFYIMDINDVNILNKELKNNNR